MQIAISAVLLSTHSKVSLRTTEQHDINGQHQWMLKALNLRKVDIWGFVRLDFVRTPLSTRKMTGLVKIGALYGWDDPRSPAMRGIRLCGVVVEALHELVVSQGPSRNVVDIGLDRLLDHEQEICQSCCSSTCRHYVP